MEDGKELSKVGIESTIRTNSTQYNQGTMAKQLIHEVVNSAENYDTIRKAYLCGRAKDISDVPKAEIIKGEKQPAIIVGSGPSLDKSIEALREWEGGIFVTTSHALSLIRMGIEPTHLVALDPFCRFEEIEGVDWASTKTKLVCHPGVWPSLVQRWPNEIILYLENIGKPDSFYSSTQKNMYTIREFNGDDIRNPVFRYMVRTDFAMFACSPPLQLFVADKLGYGSIFLCGVDFAYPFGKERFTDYTVKPEVIKSHNLNPKGYYLDDKWDSYWDRHEHPIGESNRPVKTNNGLPSEEIHIYYKKNFMSAWRLSQKTIYTTDRGAITEMPHVDIKKVVRKKGLNFKQQDYQYIRDITDRYLATVGCYVVEALEGKSFIESANPDTEIKDYMNNLNQMYTCMACKMQFQIKDDINHTGHECPSCKKTALKRNANVDIEANLARIMKYTNKGK